MSNGSQQQNKNEWLVKIHIFIQFSMLLEVIRFDHWLFLIQINEFYLKIIKEHTFKHFLIGLISI
jgi:hypothetical protein